MKSQKCLSSQDSNNDNKIVSWLKSFFKGFVLLITYEVLEELIEEAIALTITTFIAKTLSFLLLVFFTQLAKFGVKSIAKGIKILLKPIVKKLTYKIGNDKINKIKRFIDMCKEKIRNNKFLQFLKRNPKSIVGIIGGVLASLATGCASTGALYFAEVEMPLWAKIVIGCAIFAVLLTFAILGVTGAGFENQSKQALRKLAERLGFGKAVDALAIVEEEYEREQEKIAEQERKAEEERVAKYSTAWKNAIAEGTFDGSLNDFIAEMVAKEEEAKRKEEERLAEQKLANAKNEWRLAVLNGEFTGSFEEWSVK